MAKGQKYGREADRILDPVSERSFRQLTTFASISSTLYFHIPSFTPDSKTLIFLSQTRPGRDMPFDLYRVNVDGENLMQLSEGFDAHGAALAPGGKYAFVFHDQRLKRIDMDTADIEEVSGFGGEVATGGLGSASFQPDGSAYVNSVRLTEGGYGVISCPTDGSEPRIIFKTGQTISHVQADPGGSGKILFCQYREKGGVDHLMVINADGSEPRALKVQNDTGHFAWRGTSGEVFTTYCWPQGEIGVVAEVWDRPRTVALGPYFWHAGGSDDGKWYVSDTNWPDQGLFVINHETGRSRFLLRSQSSNSSAPWTHPHPMFSPDRKWVVFNSDRTGIGQIYSVEITEDFLAPLTQPVDR